MPKDDCKMTREDIQAELAATGWDGTIEEWVDYYGHDAAEAAADEAVSRLAEDVDQDTFTRVWDEAYWTVIDQCLKDDALADHGADLCEHIWRMRD